MGFGGSALAMMQTLRNNAKQLAKRERYFDKKVDSLDNGYGKIVDHKKMSPEQFEVFKQKLKQNEIRRQKHLAIVFGSIMLVIIGVLIYFLFYY